MTETERHRIEINALRIALRIVILQLDASNGGRLLPALRRLQEHMEGATLGIQESDEALERFSASWEYLFAEPDPEPDLL